MDALATIMHVSVHMIFGGSGCGGGRIVGMGEHGRRWDVLQEGRGYQSLLFAAHQIREAKGGQLRGIVVLAMRVQHTVLIAARVVIVAFYCRGATAFGAIVSGVGRGTFERRRR